MNSRKQSALDWKEFQQSLLEQIPFMGNDWEGKNIENFVQKTIKQYMPKSLPFKNGLSSLFSHSFDYDLFETHRSLFVRIRLSDDLSPDSVRFYANRRKLKVIAPDHSEEIPLPCDVNAARAIARYDDGILEIRIPKQGGFDPYREIFIRRGGK